jgi:protein-S-isoprenylcysteine O-methyltransferase Ste14
MRATNWEFRNRAWLFGALFGVAFFLYSVDPQNVCAAVANRLSASWGLHADDIARGLFVLAAVIAAAAAFLRSSGSAYLHQDIVYASDVKSASLVADGPYRYVRNPLYFGNLLLAIGVGALASRAGFAFLVVATFVFCYRLILREESELSGARGQAYEDYRRAVPRFLPSPWSRAPESGQRAQWTAGFRAESWCWSFALGLVAFVITFNQRVLWGVIVAGLLASWVFARFDPR